MMKDNVDLAKEIIIQAGWWWYSKGPALGMLAPFGQIEEILTLMTKPQQNSAQFAQGFRAKRSF